MGYWYRKARSKEKAQEGEGRDPPWGWGRVIPAGAVSGVAGTSTRPGASARWASLARLGRIAGGAGVGPGEDRRAPEEPAAC